MSGVLFPSDRLAARLGTIFALFGVVLGALAAHGPVHDYLARSIALELWHTALFQQWVHALALLAISSFRVGRACVICWLLGLIFFCGSLYLLALDPGAKWAGPLTPLGGLFLIAGWISLWLGLRGKANRDDASR